MIIPFDRLFVKGVIAASAPKADQVELGGRADPQRNAAGSDPVRNQYGHVFDPVQAAYELLFPLDSPALHAQNGKWIQAEKVPLAAVRVA